MAQARRGWGGYLLGFAFGGFFDGILLHQILQWHHLLSRVEGVDARMQVAADGYFHALMYLIAAIGLWLAWRRRRDDQEGRMLADFLVGFAVWHVVDVVAFHWILRIHNIRVDSPNPVAWDIGWMLAFSVPAAAAALLVRRSHVRPRGLALGIAIAVAAAGTFALSPVGKPPFATALFAPGVSSAAAMEAVAQAGGRIAWMDPTGQVVVFEASQVQRPLALYLEGAILVSGRGLPSGCFDWLAPSAA
jgi:uncharacterized membrane protein